MLPGCIIVMARKPNPRKKAMRIKAGQARQDPGDLLKRILDANKKTMDYLSTR